MNGLSMQSERAVRMFLRHDLRSPIEVRDMLVNLGYERASVAEVERGCLEMHDIVRTDRGLLKRNRFAPKDTTDRLLAGLTESQREAVMWDKGPKAVFATAGSGKTRVLECRAEYLVRMLGIPPEKILMTTFTNDATDVMTARVRERISESADPYDDIGIAIGTFHSISARILREVAARWDIGIGDDYDILDEERAAAFYKELDLYPQYSNIIMYKSALNQSGADIELVRAERKYSEALRKQNSLDFADLLRMVFNLSKDQRIQEYITSLWEYVMVDEFQDTNPIQYAIAQLLAYPENNLFVVGDDDQSIMTFQGADPANLLDFSAKHGSEHIVLETNFRCPQIIVDASQSLIENNQQRQPKQFQHDSIVGGGLFQYSESVELDTMDRVMNYLSYRLMQDTPYPEIAVLCRTNATLEHVYTSLVEHGISVSEYAAYPYFKRQEIQALTAYLRFKQFPYLEDEFDRIIGTVKGLGKSTIKSVIGSYQENPNVSILDHFNSMELPEKRAEVRDRVSKLFEIDSPIDYIDALISDDSPLIEFFTDKGDPYRLKRIHETAEYFKQAGTKWDAIIQRLEFSANSAATDIDGNKIQCKTIHRAKGEEYDSVIVIGDRWWSNQVSEEERRVLFVAMTRAKRDVLLANHYIPFTDEFSEHLTELDSSIYWDVNVIDADDADYKIDPVKSDLKAVLDSIHANYFASSVYDIMHATGLTRELVEQYLIDLMNSDEITISRTSSSKYKIKAILSDHVTYLPIPADAQLTYVPVGDYEDV